MVIDTCTSLGNDNPIVAIHDVGAGGISNALPELVHDSDMVPSINIRVPFSNCEMFLVPIPACHQWRSGVTSRKSVTF
jgi:phosphoribosylformylglycinamidine synthase